MYLFFDALYKKIVIQTSGKAKLNSEKTIDTKNKIIFSTGIAKNKLNENNNKLTKNINKNLNHHSLSMINDNIMITKNQNIQNEMNTNINNGKGARKR